MNAISILKRTYLLGLSMALFFISDAQTNCDTTALNAYLNPAGYKRLYVPTQPCSIYYYSNVAMYGIEAHIQSANLGIPQLIINNAQENTDVNNALYGQGVYNISPEVWLGITDSATNSGASPYHWRTFAGDTNITYFNWTAGEPNNDPPSCKVGSICGLCFGADAYWCAYGEDCAVLNASGEWLDITCEGSNVTHPCILEVNACPVVTPPADLTVCAGSSASVSATDSGGTAPYTYTWNPGNLTGQTVSITTANSETVTVQASDKFQCIATDTFTITINPNTPIANAGPDMQLCPGAVDTLGTAPNSNYTYNWTPTTGLSSTSISNPTVSFASNPGANPTNTFYILTATWGSCSSSDTVEVTLFPNINNNFTVSSSSLCGLNDSLTVTYAGTPSGTATYSWTFDSATIVSGSGAGAYELNWQTYGTKTITLSVTDNGCSGTLASQTVNVYPTPTASISDSAYILTSTPYAQYQWLFNGQPIIGDTTQTITADSNGNYRVIVTDTTGCTDTSAEYVVTGLGIMSIQTQNRIHIYPNPNNGTFIVETVNAKGGEITVTDILGRVIMSQAITMDKHTIDMNPQSIDAGEYYVTIRINGSSYTSKMVVTKD